MNALSWNISKCFPHTYTRSHKRRSWAHTRVFIANGTCLPPSWIPQARLWASSHPRCVDVSWGPNTLFNVTVNSPKSWNQAREMPFPPHTSRQLRTAPRHFRHSPDESQWAPCLQGNGKVQKVPHPTHTYNYPVFCSVVRWGRNVSSFQQCYFHPSIMFWQENMSKLETTLCPMTSNLP